MLDLKKLTARDLAKKEIKKQITAEVKDHIIGLHADLAKEFLRDLKPKVQAIPNNKAVLKYEYQELVGQLMMVALSCLSEKDMKQALQEHLTKSFSWPDYNLNNEIDAFIIAKIPLLLRDKFKKELINILHQNQEELTDKEIENETGKKVSPTVGNWLTNYDQFIGSGKADPLKKTEFIYHSPSAKLLKESEREKLIKLIDFYEHLKETSEHPRGIEEKFIFKDADRLVEVDHGKVVELGPLPEIAAEEAKPDTITIRYPEIGDIFDEADSMPPKKELQPSESEEPKKFVKPDPMKVVFDRQKKGKPRVEPRQVVAGPPLSKLSSEPASASLSKPKTVAAKLPSTAKTKSKPVSFLSNDQVRAKTRDKPSLNEALERIEKVKQEADTTAAAQTLPKPITPSAPPKKRISFLPRLRKETTQPMVSDIKAPQRVMSPLDELEQMSLEEFRKLGVHPLEIVARIKEKIDLLEQESVEKKAQGIKLWKKSPVNKLYIAIGEESIMQGKGVRQIIAQREKEGKETLTYAEFEALADLNRQLRF